jgi:excisionase family DNA binding protein
MNRHVPQNAGGIMEANSETILWSVSAACARVDLGRSTLYRLMESGDLAYVKIGTRRLIPDRSLRDLIDANLVAGLGAAPKSAS